jgi:hypothetical protein
MKSIVYLQKKTTILLLKKKSSQYSKYQQKLANRNRIKQKKRSRSLHQSLIKINRKNSLNLSPKIMKVTNKIPTLVKMNLHKKLILQVRIMPPIRLLKETMKI